MSVCWRASIAILEGKRWRTKACSRRLFNIINSYLTTLVLSCSERQWNCDICGVEEWLAATAPRALWSLIVADFSIYSLYLMLLSLLRVSSFIIRLVPPLLHSCVSSISVVPCFPLGPSLLSFQLKMKLSKKGQLRRFLVSFTFFLYWVSGAKFLVFR